MKPFTRGPDRHIGHFLSLIIFYQKNGYSKAIPSVPLVVLPAPSVNLQNAFSFTTKSHTTSPLAKQLIFCWYNCKLCHVLYHQETTGLSNSEMAIWRLITYASYIPSCEVSEVYPPFWVEYTFLTSSQYREGAALTRVHSNRSCK